MTTTTRLQSPHDHVFLGDNLARNERRTWLVIVITATMMVIEIAAGFRVRFDGAGGRRLAHVNPRGRDVDCSTCLHVRAQECA